MPYTVWCNDKLVGESELDYVANTDELKFGDFTASEYGDQLIPVLMAPRKAVCSHAPMDEIERLYERREEIRLELRGPDGAVIPTEYIEITDLEWLLTLGGSFADDWEADMELAEAELMDELRPESDDESERLDMVPPEWITDDADDQEFDEFDVPELERGDPDAPVRPGARYQIQVAFEPLGDRGQGNRGRG